jgi:hypothetical protein
MALIVGGWGHAQAYGLSMTARSVYARCGSLFNNLSGERGQEVSLVLDLAGALGRLLVASSFGQCFKNRKTHLLSFQHEETRF